MTGGVIKDNNNSLTEEARRSTRGDGVYVGTAFNLGGLQKSARITMFI